MNGIILETPEMAKKRAEEAASPLKVFMDQEQIRVEVVKLAGPTRRASLFIKGVRVLTKMGFYDHKDPVKVFWPMLDEGVATEVLKAHRLYEPSNKALAEHVKWSNKEHEKKMAELAAKLPPPPKKPSLWTTTMATTAVTSTTS